MKNFFTKKIFFHIFFTFYKVIKLNIYELLFTDKEHYITKRYRDDSHYPIRKKVWKIKHIQEFIDNQEPNTDLYITKYPTDKVIDNVILDFDSEDDIELAYKHAFRVHNYLKTKNVNSVIVESGSKGYHLYIQLYPISFKGETFGEVLLDGKRLFDIFVKELINLEKLELTTLDLTNTSAGLDGNIRLIGSTHPKTGRKCKIHTGEFIDYGNNHEKFHELMKVIHPIYERACFILKNEERVLLKEAELKVKNLDMDWDNLIENNDLREIIPAEYGTDVKSFPKGYIMTNCINHNDNNPSMVVTKEYFYCKTCGFKGNLWTLIKEGHLKREDFMVKSKGVE